MQGVYGVFIGTFLIGLREGLEATLIVSIVGAFLKRNGQSTRPMFAGVALAVLISVAVGVSSRNASGLSAAIKSKIFPSRGRGLKNSLRLNLLSGLPSREAALALIFQSPLDGSTSNLQRS